MRRFLLCLAAATLLPLGPARAQIAGSEARSVMTRFAECVVKREPELARAFVIKRPDQRLPESDFRKLVSPDCLTRTSMLVAQLRMRTPLFQGALAEGLIRGDSSVRLIDAASLPPIEWADPQPPSSLDEKGRPLGRKALKKRQEAYVAAMADTYVGRLGDCVVRADPAGALAVIMTETDTPSETDAMKAISGSLTSCVAKGQTIKFSREMLRASLAAGYYRLATAARANQAQEAVS